MNSLFLLQGDEFGAFQEAAKQVDEWPVFKTSSREVAGALGLDSCPSYTIGTSFEYNSGAFVSVSSKGHAAFSRGLPLAASLLRFLQTEQLPPYLPYSSVTNERIFALDRQVGC